MSAEVPVTDAAPVPTEGDSSKSAAPALRTRSALAQLVQFASVALLAFCSYWFISHYFLQSVKVVGISMVPTLHDSQAYLLNRWVLHVRSPHPGDIVVLRDPMDNGFSVKRVVAVGGNTVSLRGGEVFVNGHHLLEPYLVPGTPTFPATAKNQQTFTCARDQYFVLGDNRNNSIDSRVYGPVPRGNILGLVIH